MIHSKGTVVRIARACRRRDTGEKRSERGHSSRPFLPCSWDYSLASCCSSSPPSCYPDMPPRLVSDGFLLVSP